MEKFVRSRLGLLIKTNDSNLSNTTEHYEEELKKLKSELAATRKANDELSSLNLSLTSQIEVLQARLDEEPVANKPSKQKRKSSVYQDISPEPVAEVKKTKKSPTKAASSARFMRLRERHA